jgi:isocitrate lyase
VHHDVRAVLAGPGRDDEAQGIEGIYLGGWATSAKGSMHEDPGPDLASYPLSQVPNEAAPIVRALLTADKNQYFARARMTDEQRKATPEVDFRPFIIADADTGHGGDAARAQPRSAASSRSACPATTSRIRSPA